MVRSREASTDNRHELFAAAPSNLTQMEELR